MRLKFSWDKYALSRNIMVFTEKNGNKTMKSNFFKDHLHRKITLKSKIIKRKEIKTHSYFYNFLIKDRNHKTAQCTTTVQK